MDVVDNNKPYNKDKSSNSSFDQKNSIIIDRPPLETNKTKNFAEGSNKRKLLTDSFKKRGHLLRNVKENKVKSVYRLNNLNTHSSSVKNLSYKDQPTTSDLILDCKRSNIKDRHTLDFSSNASVETSKKKGVLKKRVWDKTDRCLFCKKNITNFTRHIILKHKDEIEVTKFEALRKGSKERKLFADSLRKRGNFSCILEGNRIKPVRRPNVSNSLLSAKDYLPCKHCYGVFKKKYLFRHFKLCKNNRDKTEGRNQPQSDGKNMLVAFTGTDKELVEKVFPKMVNDDISFVAKSDKLITALGSRYLKCYKGKHSIAVVSQKMRTLGRFLLAMRIEVSSINSLMDCLSPMYYDVMVKCSKKISRCNHNTDSLASSLFKKLGVTLKQCCEIAEFILLKENDAKNVNTFDKDRESIITVKQMIENQFSKNSLKELDPNKWDKPALLTLTSDIKFFRDHLIFVERESYYKLKSNPDDMQAYIDFQESILMQIELLNRRRTEEVQYILLDDFNGAQLEILPENIFLSPVEMELTKSFKMVVVQGTCGQNMPVLFTSHLKLCLQYLLELRETASFMNNDNPYLFALTQSASSCMRVSDIMLKFGEKCGIHHLESITSKHLKKHVATVSQILNLSEGEIEQLATFMGHTKNIYKHFYRLSENVFQVAKVCKLLLSMEKSRELQFKKKSLDGLIITAEDLVSDEEQGDGSDKDEKIERLQCNWKSFDDIKDIDENVISDKELDNRLNESLTTDQINVSKQTSNHNMELLIEEKCSPSDRYKISKRTMLDGIRSFTEEELPITIKQEKISVKWSEKEKTLMKHFFENNIHLDIPLKKKECEHFMKIYQINSHWKRIKDFIHNAANTYKKQNQFNGKF